jgi:hypothetical protein
MILHSCILVIKGDLGFMLNQRAGTPMKPDGYEGIRLYWSPIDLHETRERLTAAELRDSNQTALPRALFAAWRRRG